MIDSREAFVPGYDLEGDFMPDQEREELRLALLASAADTDEQIRSFVSKWLSAYSDRKRKRAVSA